MQYGAVRVGEQPVRVHTCEHVQRTRNQQAVAHESGLEPRELSFVLVWLENSLSSDLEMKASFKTTIYSFICHQTETLKLLVDGFEGHHARPSVVVCYWMQFADHIICFLLPDKAVPRKEIKNWNLRGEL